MNFNLLNSIFSISFSIPSKDNEIEFATKIFRIYKTWLITQKESQTQNNIITIDFSDVINVLSNHIKDVNLGKTEFTLDVTNNEMQKAFQNAKFLKLGVMPGTSKTLEMKFVVNGEWLNYQKNEPDIIGTQFVLNLTNWFQNGHQTLQGTIDALTLDGKPIKQIFNFK